MVNSVLTSGPGSVMVPLCPWLLNVNTAAVLRRPHDMRRLWLYVALLVWRALVLYLAIDFIEQGLQGQQSSSCWYGQLRREGLCNERFDASDHIVLLMTFAATGSLECFAASQDWQSGLLVRVNSADHQRPQRSRRLSATLQLAVTLYMAVLLFSIFETASFFHTRAENLCGWLIACLGLHAPLWLQLRRRGKLYEQVVAPRPVEQELLGNDL
eukprot:COSAG05_NODE_66_length_22253_cov_14.954455_14_plen_213_part_00